MAKSPVAGRVKTRLGRRLGVATATRFYRSTCAAVIGRVGVDRRWETWLAVSPDRDLTNSVWPGEIPRRPQGGGDLGRRMQRIMDTMPPGPVIIVGTDIPAISPTAIAAAFEGARRRGAVLGPTGDGGYWLVGLRRTPRVERIFDDVRWSTRWTLEDTARHLSSRGYALATQLHDVDEAEDLVAVRHTLGRRILPRA